MQRPAEQTTLQRDKSPYDARGPVHAFSGEQKSFVSGGVRPFHAVSDTRNLDL